ncbi:T9SS type A sorting domain-containing protein [Psychroserpens sp. SPM9]|uniref:T9SS type A sorting domain-containing protein n=1 Tax=Psychroserpens sp. SPM9 TaxID=2975598 RepID=UPI0021A27E1E|nr:T9SS type A sorting domain-containing protein [Psychroserpens sp. SPM9]MDG5491442.1 T9SS type A sorting domain-containing protein [Psychroserpens sp. SPM9]
MKNFLLCVALFVLQQVSAQDGDTINDAIYVNGANVSVNVLDYDTATKSELEPACSSEEDVFYQHPVLAGENKVTIGMASAGVILLTQFNYQILVAPGGNLLNLQEITCDNYVVPILANANFELVIDNVNPGDVYYLRVYKPDGLGGLLTGLLSGTLISMTSEFDATLSTSEVERDQFDYFVNNQKIKLFNINSTLNYKIYNLEGKLILKNDNQKQFKSIDISTLSKGLYVLNIEHQNLNKVFKFVKY